MLRLIRLGIKSHFGSWRALLFAALAPPLAIAAAAVAAVPALARASASAELSIVFCDLENSPYIDMAIGLATADESFRRSVSMRKLGYDEAFQELEAGRADAVAVFPDGFVKEMAEGVNKPVNVVLGDTDPIKATLAKELMDCAAAQVSAAQAAINTAWRYTGGDFGALVIEYASKALARGLYVADGAGAGNGAGLGADLGASRGADLGIGIGAGNGAGLGTDINEGIGVSEGIGTGIGVDVVEHLVSSYLALFVFLCGAIAAKGASAYDSLGISARLASSGAKPAKAAFCQYAPMLAVVFATAVAAVVFAGGSALAAAWAFGRAGAGMAAAGTAAVSATAAAGIRFTLWNALFCLIVLLFLCAFSASFAQLASRAARGAQPAEMSIVTLGLFMAVAGGAAIPYQYLPDALRAAGPFTFNYWAKKLLASAMFDPIESAWRFLGLLAEAGRPLAVFAALSALMFAASTALGPRAKAARIRRAGSCGRARHAPGRQQGASRALPFARFLQFFATRAKSMLSGRLGAAMLIAMPFAALACIWAMLAFYVGGGKRIPVGVLDLDGGVFARAACERFSLSESIEARPIEGAWPALAGAREAAEGLIAEGAIEAAVIVLPGFTENLRHSRPEGVVEIIPAQPGLTRGLVKELFSAQISRIYFASDAASKASGQGIGKGDPPLPSLKEGGIGGNHEVPLEERADASDASKAVSAHEAEASDALWEEAFAWAEGYWEPEPLMTIEYGAPPPHGEAVKAAAARDAKDAGQPASAAPRSARDILNALAASAIAVAFFAYAAACQFAASASLVSDRASGMLARLKSISGSSSAWFMASAAVPLVFYGVPSACLLLLLFGGGADALGLAATAEASGASAALRSPLPSASFPYAAAASLPLFAALGAAMAWKAKNHIQYQIMAAAATAVGSAVAAATLLAAL